MLQRICNTRLREARSLLRDGHFPGAFYLAGYAVECALKVCVAKQIRQFDFPDKKFVNDAFTHELEKLVSVAGLKLAFANDRQRNPALELNWAIVKDWGVESRYELAITKAQAQDLYSACAARKNGVLAWIKRRW